MAIDTQSGAVHEASTKQLIKRLRARLDRWELAHLRTLAASLDDQLQAATERAQRAEAQAADYWRYAEEMQEELRGLADDSGATLGLTQAGSVVVLKPDASAVPAPGQHWPAMGGTYIGIASAEVGMPAHHLVVLDAKCDTHLDWEDAKAWAAQLGDSARLPTQLEAMLAWTNARSAFEKGYHWTSTQVSRDGAFVQDFEDGDSGWLYKDVELRVRAFRGLELHTLKPLTLAAEGGSVEISADGAA